MGDARRAPAEPPCSFTVVETGSRRQRPCSFRGTMLGPDGRRYCARHVEHAWEAHRRRQRPAAPGELEHSGRYPVVAERVVAGILLPDQDFRREWERAVPVMAADIRHADARSVHRE
jgi:hypothetical protein